MADQEVEMSEVEFGAKISGSEFAKRVWPFIIKTPQAVKALANSDDFVTALLANQTFMTGIETAQAPKQGKTAAQALGR